MDTKPQKRRSFSPTDAGDCSQGSTKSELSVTFSPKRPRRVAEMDAEACLRDASEPDGAGCIALRQPQQRNAACTLHPREHTRLLPTTGAPPPPSLIASDTAHNVTTPTDDWLSDADLQEAVDRFDEQQLASQPTSSGDGAVNNGQKQTPFVEEDMSDDEFERLTYGLLPASSDGAAGGVDHLSLLPPEVLRRLLSHLPMYDLLFVVGRLSRHFHAAVADPTFLKWRKLYHRYRCDVDAKGIENKELSPLAAVDHSRAWVALLLFVQRSFVSVLLPSQRGELMGRLQQCDEHSMAEQWIERVLSKELKQWPSVWTELCTTVLFCGDAIAIDTLLRQLTRSPSCVDPQLILECLYLLALLLLMLHRRLRITPRYHYDLYTTIHFYESDKGVVAPSVALGATAPHRLTYEQRRIVNRDLSADECLRVVALAGTGKTSTLVEYVRRRPHLRFLVLVFNHEVAIEAKRTFPSNAECRTTHSLAMHFGGRSSLAKRYSHKQSFYTPTLTQLTQMIDGVPKGSSLFMHAKRVERTLANFYGSEDEEITEYHCPSTWTTYEMVSPEHFELVFCGQEVLHKKVEVITETEKKSLAASAKKIWAKTRDLSDTTVKMTFDGYLKLFQLNKPTLYDEATGKPWDAIIVDEAQDLNPSTLSVVLGQRCARIFVGDPHQQIYSFRGAVNALGRLPPAPQTHTLHLTQSFRFGPRIGLLANCWLERELHLKKKLLIGTKREGSLFLDGTNTPSGVVTICRTNATVFDECASAASRGRSVYIMGGLEKIGIQRIVDIYQLSLSAGKRQAMRDKLIKGFKDLATLENWARDRFNDDILQMIRIVKKHKGNTPVVVGRIKEQHVYSHTEAQCVFTTVHKAKGMEFDCVRLASDLQDTAESDDDEDTSDEKNLIYVAMTRARRTLIMNKYVYDFMTDTMDECFEHPVTVEKASAEMAVAPSPFPDPEHPEAECSASLEVLRCLNCRRAIMPQDQLVLLQAKVTLTEPVGRERQRLQGVRCPKCAGAADNRLVSQFDSVIYNNGNNASTASPTAKAATRRFTAVLYNSSDENMK